MDVSHLNYSKKLTVMLDASSIFYLAMFTLTAGLVVGSVQYARVRRSQKRDRRYDRGSSRARRAFR